MIEKDGLHNDDNSNEVFDDQEQQVWEKINEYLRQRAQKIAASIEPLAPKNHE